MKNIKTYLLLHLLMLVYSFSPICSKLAGQQAFLSPAFFLYYGAVIFLLGVYAILWQQIIKRLPLTTAYANKAITVIWGMIWGAMIFKEAITWQKLLGAIIIVVGVVLYATSDKEEANAK